MASIVSKILVLLFVSFSVNRRMDEWVLLSRIDVTRGSVEEGAKGDGYGLNSLSGRDRKVTRNLKRKHDEINHIQKVSTVFCVCSSTCTDILCCL